MRVRGEGRQERYPLSCSPVFDMVMQDEGLCMRFIERVLGMEVEAIEYRAIEHVVETGLSARGVCLDVYARGATCAYNVEMQAYRQAALDRRLRYLQHAMDSTLLGRGEPYAALPESWIVFVCDHDPYGEGIPVYDLERACLQRPAMAVRDGSHWRVLNARGWQDEPEEGLRMLLKYISTGDPSGDALACELDAAVDEVNRDPERRAQVSGFMTLEHSMQALAYEQRAEGRVEGLAEGQARYGALASRLLAEGRADDLERSTRDPRLLEALYAEYGL